MEFQFFSFVCWLFGVVDWCCWLMLVWLVCYLIVLNVLSLREHLIINDKISILIQEIIHSLRLISSNEKLMKSCRGVSEDFE